MLCGFRNIDLSAYDPHLCQRTEARGYRRTGFWPNFQLEYQGVGSGIARIGTRSDIIGDGIWHVERILVTVNRDSSARKRRLFMPVFLRDSLSRTGLCWLGHCDVYVVVLPMTMAGFAGSVRKDIPCGPAATLVPPSFM